MGKTYDENDFLALEEPALQRALLRAPDALLAQALLAAPRAPGSPLVLEAPRFSAKPNTPARVQGAGLLQEAAR